MYFLFLCCVQDVQQKVRPYIAGVDMAHFKYDAFIRVLDIVNRSALLFIIHILICKVTCLHFIRLMCNASLLVTSMRLNM